MQRVIKLLKLRWETLSVPWKKFAHMSFEHNMSSLKGLGWKLLACVYFKTNFLANRPFYKPSFEQKNANY